MRKILLLIIGGFCLFLVGCGSSSEGEVSKPSDSSQVTEKVDMCEKYVSLFECVLKSQSLTQSGDDQQAYIDMLKSAVASYPIDQRQAYCTEEWNNLLPNAAVYAEFGCPME